MKKEDIILKIEDVTFESNGTKIIKGVSFVLQKQESLVFVGSSGSGKSTLLKIISGILTPSSGSITIKDTKLHHISRSEKMNFLVHNVGFVFQDGALINDLNTFENIALPLKYHTDLKESVIRDRVYELLEKFELARVANSYPATLSLGQRKLVSFARTMIMDPDIIFFDEPVASLDIESADRITDYIKGYIILGGTAVSISHDMFFANSLASLLGIIDDGKILAFGPPSHVKFSDSPKIKRILKSVSKEADLADELLRLMT